MLWSLFLAKQTYNAMIVLKKQIGFNKFFGILLHSIHLVIRFINKSKSKWKKFGKWPFISELLQRGTSQFLCNLASMPRRLCIQTRDLGRTIYQLCINRALHQGMEEYNRASMEVRHGTKDTTHLYIHPFVLSVLSLIL